jgi:antirestriction protein ArdC
MPVNGATGRHYHGINLLLLAMSAFAAGSDDPRWCTYKQAADRGWQVRRGERGTTVFFYKKLVVDQPKSDPEQHGTKTIPLLRAFTVFHASQIDGIPSLEPPVAAEPVLKRIETVETILRNGQIDVRIGGSRAFYCPSTDHIQMPPDSCFGSAESRAAVLLHEVGHASGAKHRLNRDLSGSVGSESYAREEIRAEIFSCTIGATLGLPTDIPNHASYIHS